MGSEFNPPPTSSPSTLPSASPSPSPSPSPSSPSLTSLRTTALPPVVISSPAPLPPVVISSPSSSSAPLPPAVASSSPSANPLPVIPLIGPVRLPHRRVGPPSLSQQLVPSTPLPQVPPQPPVVLSESPRSGRPILGALFGSSGRTVVSFNSPTHNYKY